MEDPVASFLKLDAARQKMVHVVLLARAVAALEGTYPPGGKTVYFENLCGTKQHLDHTLPRDALAAIERGEDHEAVAERYLEPLAALQEESIRLPEPLDFGYYAVYNGFRLHVLGEQIDPWLVANQALSVCEQQDVRSAFDNAMGLARS